MHESHLATPLAPKWLTVMLLLLYRCVDKWVASITMGVLISNVLTMYIINIPAGAFDTAITVVVAHCLFIISHWPHMF